MKVVLTGPESIGKTTLTHDIAKHYNTTVVSEYARTYLANMPNGEYEQEDLLNIANAQLTKEMLVERRQIVICDTSLLVIYIWSLVKYGDVDPKIEEMLKHNNVDLYILPHWNIPYEPDPQRENEFDRKELYKKYLDELKKRHLPFTTVVGDKEQRLSLAVQTIDTLKKYG